MEMSRRGILQMRSQRPAIHTVRSQPWKGYVARSVDLPSIKHQQRGQGGRPHERKHRGGCTQDTTR
jgi:hypothetical protein